MALNRTNVELKHGSEASYGMKENTLNRTNVELKLDDVLARLVPIGSL